MSLLYTLAEISTRERSPSNSCLIVPVNNARFLELASDKIPTLRGAKISSRELPALFDCMQVADGRFQVMIGTDEVIITVHQKIFVVVVVVVVLNNQITAIRTSAHILGHPS
jgi:hypothetical protein